MKILIDRNSRISIFHQIYREIENRITSGILKPEDPLPSIRKMCQELGVSAMTVVRVYDRLSEHGLVEKIHGKGTFVRSQLGYSKVNLAEQHHALQLNHNHASADSTSDTWQGQIKDYVSVASFLYNAKYNLKSDGIDLSKAVLGEHLLPTTEIMDGFYAAYNENNGDFGGYPPIEGDSKMRQAVKEFLIQFNIHATLEEILITSGSQQAISLTATTFVGPGDVVVVGAPTYPGAIDIFKSRGAILIEVPVDKDGIDPFSLLSICEKHPVKMVYVMPSFQNPTGAVMTLERKQMLLELSDIHNFIILEDDVCGQLSYEGSVEPLKALDTSGRVIYICGFSKLYGPAYRLSSIIASGSIYARLVSAKSILDLGSPLINQIIFAPYLNSLKQQQYLIRLKFELKALRDRIYKVLKRCLPNYVHVEKPRGGMLFWLTFPREFNCRLLHYRAIEEQNIAFLPGELCYIGRRGSHQIRLCFTNIEESQLVEAIKTLCGLMDDIFNESKSRNRQPIV